MYRTVYARDCDIEAEGKGEGSAGEGDWAHPEMVGASRGEKAGDQKQCTARGTRKHERDILRKGRGLQRAH